MSLYSDWMKLAQEQRSKEEYDAYWKAYFEKEKENYRTILADKDKQYSGTVAELSETFHMDPTTFVGFLDGANSSLAEGKIELEPLTEESTVTLHFDFDKLYKNMLNAKADWLYELPEWEGVRSEEQRQELAREFRASKVFHAEKTVGRNDPCPCGSGKKYKKCCGRNA